ncbi:DUF4159 domain-containing protein [Candidatus Latescibacterota bacterium]
MKKLFLILLVISLIIGNVATAYSQDDYGFRFVRVIYDETGSGGGRNSFFGGSQRGRGGGFRGGRGQHWATDYPTADLNLHEAISRTTNILLMGEPLALSFNDPEIFEYPVLYLTEPGYWQTNPEEVKNMQKYLARGGFLIIDDFDDNGGFQWPNFYVNIKQVFPDRELIPIADNDPIWSIYYDIDSANAPSTKPGFSAEDCEYYAIYDDDGRMMCFISYNQDIGDGWEWPGRLDEASTVSFQMAINIIMHALTH